MIQFAFNFIEIVDYRSNENANEKYSYDPYKADSVKKQKAVDDIISGVGIHPIYWELCHYREKYNQENPSWKEQSFDSFPIVIQEGMVFFKAPFK